MDQSDIDRRIQDYYGAEFDEGGRLTTRSAQGRLELDRVHELLRRFVREPSDIVDIGGATGVHASRLARQGHHIVLVDPVEAQVAKASEYGTFEAKVGDARNLDLADDSFDVALLLGPLYHLVARADRLHALEEARRVVRPGGLVLAAAIPRLVAHASAYVTRSTDDLDRDGLWALLHDGEPVEGLRFPGGHFHTGEELIEELTAAGLVEADAYALEGPMGLVMEQTPPGDDELHRAALAAVRLVENRPGDRELTNHLMGVARVPS